jgi:hypothetical protein
MKNVCRILKLKDGRILIGLWPNAGKFISMTDNRQKDIPVSEVVEVRLTHHSLGLDCNGE